MCKNFILFLPPVCLLALVIWAYYVYIVQYCILFLANTAKRSAYITIYHFLLLMFMWSYFQTILKQHKPIPEEFFLTEKEHEKLLTYKEEENDQILKKLINLRKLEIHTQTDKGNVRYCKECHVIKPDRTHHCTTCNKCILKMDHHCPWVSNCVGFSNYKQFALTLLYATLWLGFYIATSVEHVLKFFEGISEKNLDKLVLAAGFVSVVTAFLLVGILFVYHVGLICRNETTLESLREINYRNNNLTFDVGKWQNFKQVFGENICTWLIPCSEDYGNGYEFPIRNLGV